MEEVLKSVKIINIKISVAPFFFLTLSFFTHSVGNGRKQLTAIFDPFTRSSINNSRILLPNKFQGLFIRVLWGEMREREREKIKDTLRKGILYVGFCDVPFGRAKITRSNGIKQKIKENGIINTRKI